MWLDGLAHGGGAIWRYGGLDVKLGESCFASVKLFGDGHADCETEVTSGALCTRHNKCDIIWRSLCDNLVKNVRESQNYDILGKNCDAFTMHHHTMSVIEYHICCSAFFGNYRGVGHGGGWGTRPRLFLYACVKLVVVLWYCSWWLQFVWSL
jgi:hypothetical protein